MSEIRRPRWTFVTTRHRHCLVFAFTAGWHTGWHLGIKGADLSLGLGLWSLHFGYRMWPDA